MLLEHDDHDDDEYGTADERNDANNGAIVPRHERIINGRERERINERTSDRPTERSHTFLGQLVLRNCERDSWRRNERRALQRVPISFAIARIVVCYLCFVFSSFPSFSFSSLLCDYPTSIFIPRYSHYFTLSLHEAHHARPDVTSRTG